jgi:predicted urease superfamily metal-dependent hydrolase
LEGWAGTIDDITAEAPCDFMVDSDYADVARRPSRVVLIPASDVFYDSRGIIREKIRTRGIGK